MWATEHGFGAETVIAWHGLGSFHGLGASMGGAIGTRAAANGLRGRVRRLVPNDNGPEPAPAAIERLRDQAGRPAGRRRSGQ